MASETLKNSSKPVPLLEPDIGPAERARVDQCLADNWVSSAGPYVSAFEKRVAGLANRRHGIATASGTAALHLALLSLGIGRDDFVLVPDWTFSASANAVIHAGAVPVFIDIDPESWDLDASSLEQALSGLDRKPAAMMVVDPPSLLGDLPRWEAMARGHGIPLIEDAAGALGSRRESRPAGHFGTLSTFSFNGNKILTTGGGGMMVTDDDALAEKARHFSAQARTGQVYRYDAAGYNFRMPSLNAALGLAQCDRLDAMLSRKREIAARYRAFFDGNNHLSFMPLNNLQDSNAWMSCCVTDTTDAAEDLVRHLDVAGIMARPFWCGLSDQPPYQAYPAYLSGGSARLSGRVVSLPSSSTLTDQDLDRVLAALQEWPHQQGLPS
ncbi:DegT/DnrJ/EryC1/StrS family aminotransferase [Aestuariispira insulae]|uniref:dTDP-4-amino-4,6-dideoxygalactose transaminase n=1 Tax=Aestuariispira insulae TaxID=1461337 RepID=A0A3D9H9J4_9PROT|nr:aminotransferase class I/II-fold pyridoxal phosphate-dependent enzyme [Aestuariispira insulae]RED46170.1 dTDP-4-amino-4,6-dideoxygalactose transaminase [Aestuariispira insulae]